MIKMLSVFAFVFIILYFGIDMFRQFTGRERWSFIKNAIHASVVAALAISFLILIVILF